MTLTRRTLLRTALVAAASSLPGCAVQRGQPGVQRLPGTGRPIRITMPFQRIAYGAGPQQYGELRRPSGGLSPAVAIVVHGDVWRSPDDLHLMVPLCEALAREGLATWNIEYRRIGDPGGGWPGTFLDVGAAADHLRTIAPQHGLDLQRIVTLGHSAGGQLALWLAGRRWIRDGELRVATPLKLQAAMALAGIVDLRRAWEIGLGPVAQLMGGSPAQVPHRYVAGDPAALIPLGVPQVLVHGSADTVVPESLSAHYVREATSRGDEARLVALPGTGHFELIDPDSAAWSTVREQLHRLLT